MEEARAILVACRTNENLSVWIDADGHEKQFHLSDVDPPASSLLLYGLYMVHMLGSPSDASLVAPFLESTNQTVRDVAAKTSKVLEERR